MCSHASCAVFASNFLLVRSSVKWQHRFSRASSAVFESARASSRRALRSPTVTFLNLVSLRLYRQLASR